MTDSDGVSENFRLLSFDVINSYALLLIDQERNLVESALNL